MLIPLTQEDFTSQPSAQALGKQLAIPSTEAWGASDRIIHAIHYGSPKLRLLALRFTERAFAGEFGPQAAGRSYDVLFRAIEDPGPAYEDNYKSSVRYWESTKRTSEKNLAQGISALKESRRQLLESLGSLKPAKGTRLQISAELIGSLLQHIAKVKKAIRHIYTDKSNSIRHALDRLKPALRAVAKEGKPEQGAKLKPALKELRELTGESAYEISEEIKRLGFLFNNSGNDLADRLSELGGELEENKKAAGKSRAGATSEISAFIKSSLKGERGEKAQTNALHFSAYCLEKKGKAWSEEFRRWALENIGTSLAGKYGPAAQGAALDAIRGLLRGKYCLHGEGVPNRHAEDYVISLIEKYAEGFSGGQLSGRKAEEAEKLLLRLAEIMPSSLQARVAEITVAAFHAYAGSLTDCQETKSDLRESVKGFAKNFESEPFWKYRNYVRMVVHELHSHPVVGREPISIPRPFKLKK